MNKAFLLLVIMAVVGCTFGRPQQQLFPQLQIPNRPLPSLFPGGGSAAGFGNGAVQNGAAIGTGTGIANPGQGGFGIGLGVGAAVASPVGNFALGQGQSISAGK